MKSSDVNNFVNSIVAGNCKQFRIKEQKFYRVFVISPIFKYISFFYLFIIVVGVRVLQYSTMSIKKKKQQNRIAAITTITTTTILRATCFNVYFAGEYY